MKRNIIIVSIYVSSFIILAITATIIQVAFPNLLDTQENVDKLNTYFSIGLEVYLLTALIVYLRKYLKEMLIDYKNRMKELFKIAIIGAIGMYGVSFIAGIIMTVLGFNEQSNNQAGIDSMLANADPLQVVLLITFIVIMAPIVEELVFRKGIYGIAGKLSYMFLSRQDEHITSQIDLLSDSDNDLQVQEIHEEKMSIRNEKRHKISSIVAIIVSSLAFGGIHISGDPIYLLIYGGMGAALGTVYYFSKKNIIVPIIVHMMWNGFIVLVTFVFV